MDAHGPSHNHIISESEFIVEVISNPIDLAAHLALSCCVKGVSRWIIHSSGPGHAICRLTS